MLNRRAFIWKGGVGGALMLAGCRSEPSQIPQASSSSAFSLEEATFSDLQQRMASGDLTAAAITQQYLERIEQIDRQTLNAVIELNPDALAIADALDRERKAGNQRGPLHGIPLLLKDNIDTADRMHTSAGSLALAASIPSLDAFVAQKLREAGAVLLGKANLSEWANFRSTRSTSGWSGRGGQTRNPYALDRNPCGSSSGSGAAVSANLCAAALGTETDGSIVCPSSANGIVGIKPTLGLVSRAGIIPISHSQDTAGPMARTVADAAVLLGALTGADPRDDATAAAGRQAYADYTPFLDPEGLRGARIGVARNFFGFDPRVDALMESALDAMKQQGAEIIDPAEVPGVGAYGDAEFTVLLYEFKHDLNRYLEGLPEGTPVRSLEDLIAFNEANREQEMPYFGQDIFLMAQQKGPLTDDAYRKALEKSRRLSREEGIDKVMGANRLDALVAPTGGPAWLTDLVNGDHFSGGSSQPAAMAGYPNITVPAGSVFGLPVGLSFFGRAYSEPVLIRLAYAYEQASRHRRLPQLLPSVGLEG